MGRLRAFGRKIIRLGGSPRGIAGGFALGVGLSLVPIPVLGMLTALALAPALRCNLPATYLGTAIVNPLTGAFFYFAELWLGMWLTGQPAPSWVQMRGLDGMGWWHLFLDLLGPFTLGATIIIAAAVGITFPLLYWATARWQARRHRRSADAGATLDDAERDPGR